jgi:hypothetical protein
MGGREANEDGMNLDRTPSLTGARGSLGGRPPSAGPKGRASRHPLLPGGRRLVDAEGLEPPTPSV